MYSKKVAYKDFRDNPRNEVVHFNLTEREVFKLMVEFKAIFEWQETIKDRAEEETPTEEVVEFYNNFEEILLAAYGVPSADGRYFDKSDRYKFEESALFNAAMLEFVQDPSETSKLIDGLMPKGLQEVVKNADDNLAQMASSKDTDDVLRKEIERLRAKLNDSEDGEQA